MSVLRKFIGSPAMASPWRRRTVCCLKWEQSVPAALHDVSASGATLATGARLPVGTHVELIHPEAGSIPATVTCLRSGAIEVAFDRSEYSMAFALAAITADMSSPA
jgi:hypothetical protein